jgi:uncharacterized damage-inducible protein DinB
MDCIATFRRLFAYDAWANREALASLAAAGEAESAGTALPPRALAWLAHVAAAERLWLHRLRRDPTPVVVWPDLNLDECAAAIEECACLVQSYLDGLAPADLDAPVDYVNSQGEPWTSRVEDVLQHVVMHSTYHRGQIAAALRQAGATPATTDFIHAARQGWIE